jgi:hypothetical protein
MGSCKDHGYCWLTRAPDEKAYISGAINHVWYTANQDEVVAFHKMQTSTPGVPRPFPQPGAVILRVIYQPKRPT